MRYYANEKADIGYDKYAVKRKGSFILIRFEDKDIPDYFDISRKYYAQNTDLGNIYTCVGSDNRLYSFNIDTEEMKAEKKCSLLMVFLSFNRFAKYYSNKDAKRKHIEETYDKDIIIEQKSGKNDFKKYTFIDRENTRSVAFRLRESTSKEKAPLFIFFHGADGIGDNNRTQMRGARHTVARLQGEKCHVLYPQCDMEYMCFERRIYRHAVSVRKLIDLLSERIQIDYEKIYIVGFSFGGACVWHSLYEYPHFYAGAIPLMGYFMYRKSDSLQIKNFENANIWIGHAEIDNVVPIDDDNAMYELLSHIDCNVKISRYTKYGHRMSSVFMRKEKWAEWLLEQRLTKKD